MANKYLSKDGVIYLWSKIKSTFATQTTVDDLAEQIEQLVTEGGEPNQNAFTTVAVTSGGSTTNIVADTKTDTLTITAGSNVTITPNANTDTLTIAATDTTYPDATTSVKGVVQLSSATNSTSTALAATASAVKAAYDHGGVTSVNGSTGAVTLTIPTNNNQLTNGAGYQTASQVTAAINSALADVTGISYEVVASLPATGQAGVIYLISNNGTNPNIYDEYIYYNDVFEKIGTTDVDLSGYMLTTDMVAITNAEIDTIAV